MSEMERPGEYSRRKTLLAVGTGLLAGLAGCTDVLSDGTTTPTTNNTTATPETPPPTAVTDPGPQPPQARGRLGRQFERVRTATSRYEDVTVARADGYSVLGPNMDGMGWHLLDQRGVESAAKTGFTRTDPPMLTYLETDRGLTLASVEYAVPVAATPETPDIFADEGSQATERWRTHPAATHVFATPDDGQTSPADLPPETVLTDEYWAEFRPADPSLGAGDTVSLNWGSTEGKSGDRTSRVVDAVITHPDLRTLHVWLHEKNPDGMFAHSHPHFSDHEGGHHHGGDQQGGHGH